MILTVDKTSNLTDYMFSKRILFLVGDIDEERANSVIAQLLYLNSLEKKPIRIHLSTYGGDTIAGMALCDTIQYIESDVHIICTGAAISMGVIILAHGNYRYALKNSTIMMHQPLCSGAPRGWNEKQFKIYSEQLSKTRENLAESLARATKQSVEKINRDMENDYYMNSQQALEYGIIDEIVC